MTGGKLFHLASSSANIGSIAALFAAPFAESLDFWVESGIVRSLSWGKLLGFAVGAKWRVTCPGCSKRTPPSDSGSEARWEDTELPALAIGRTLPIVAASRHWSLHTPTDGDGDEAAR